MPRTVLVVDDEAAARYAMCRVFSSGSRVLEAASVAEARERIASGMPDLILLDYTLPDGDGMALLREIGAGGPAVIMITAHGSERLAVEAMKAGAYDYLAKPFDLDELRLVVQRALERAELREEVRGLRQHLAGEGQFGRMAGESAAMRKLFGTAERIAATDLPVLLLGESGTGKDLLAQEIHARSGRAQGRFVALNCAALPETLVESELFGFEKGAFTGAETARAGTFERAHQGTLFLDEIADMTLGTQSKILRAVESGAIERLGGTRSIPVDVRVISATNKDVNQLVRDGGFRRDLYYRLCGIVLRLPPLRERREDIPLLVQQLWRDLQRKHGRPGPVLTHDAVVRLASAPWPGNVRQLRSELEKLFVLIAGETVRGCDVESGREGLALEEALDAAQYREAKRLFEAEYLARKLREFEGNVTKTAAAVGLERQSLQEKIRQLGIGRQKK
ncbi:MAG: sigma-54-dependent Fis family transcriptional regulator [Bryobacterales bacterium]|nr:sigma-54-dependent Fis family transcriptional regulator [Bryobacterales bacterium]